MSDPQAKPQSPPAPTNEAAAKATPPDAARPGSEPKARARSGSRLRVRALLLGGLMLVAFVGMASIFAPSPTRAGETPELPSEAYSAISTDNLRPLGQLEAGGYRVEIFSSAHGPRYNVYDARGVQLTDLASAGEVASRFPHLDIRGAQADVPLRVMGTDVGGNGW